MGMFDCLKISPIWLTDMPPKLMTALEGRVHSFQSEDLGKTMQTFQIDAEGQLWLEETEWVDDPGYRFSGGYEKETGKLLKQTFTGGINFYTSAAQLGREKNYVDYGWYEKRLTLIEGRVLYQKLIQSRDLVLT